MRALIVEARRRRCDSQINARSTDHLIAEPTQDELKQRLARRSPSRLRPTGSPMESAATALIAHADLVVQSPWDLERVVSDVRRLLARTTVEVRDYTFDPNGNGTQLTVTPEGGTPQVISYAHATADRLGEVTGGPAPGAYGYDINGNTTSMPGRTLTWSGANRLKSASQSGVTVTWGLDAAGRTLTRSDGTDTSTYHYTRDGDSPAWTVDDGILTRYVGGPAGLSAAHKPDGDTTCC